MKVASELILSCVNVSIYPDDDRDTIHLVSQMGTQLFTTYLNTYFQDSSAINIFKNTDSIDEDNFTKLIERRFITLRQIFTKNTDTLGPMLVQALEGRISSASRYLDELSGGSQGQNQIQQMSPNRSSLVQLSHANHLIALGTFLVFGHSRLCFHYLDYSFSGFEDFQFAQTSDKMDSGGMQAGLHDSFKLVVLGSLFTLHNTRSRMKQAVVDETAHEMTQMCEAYFLGVVCLEGLHNSTLVETQNPLVEPGDRKNRVIATRLSTINHVLQSAAGWSEFTNHESSGILFTAFVETSMLELVKLAQNSTSCRSGLYILNTLSNLLDKIKQKLNNHELQNFPSVSLVIQSVLDLRGKVFVSEMSKETREFRKGIYRFLGCCMFEDEVDDFLPSIIKYGQELFAVMVTEENLSRNPKGALLGLFSALSGMLDAVISPRVAGCIVKLFYPRIRKLLDQYGPAVMGNSDFVEGLFEIYKSLNTMLSNHFTSHNILLGLDIIRDECQITLAVLSPLIDRFKTMNVKQVISTLKEHSDVLSYAFSICTGLLNSQALDVASLGYFGDSLFFSYFQLMYQLAGVLLPLLDVDPC